MEDWAASRLVDGRRRGSASASDRRGRRGSNPRKSPRMYRAEGWGPGPAPSVRGLPVRPLPPPIHRSPPNDSGSCAVAAPLPRPGEPASRVTHQGVRQGVERKIPRKRRKTRENMECKSSPFSRRVWKRG